MASWRSGIGLGFLAWLVMAVTGAATAAWLGVACVRRAAILRARDGLFVGLVWLAICVLIDAPLMLFGGPMQMSLTAYLGDIGLTYLAIPLVTWAVAAAAAAAQRRPR
jgi:hypothetical protein